MKQPHKEKSKTLNDLLEEEASEYLTKVGFSSNRIVTSKAQMAEFMRKFVNKIHSSK